MDDNQKHNHEIELQKQRFLERYSFLVTGGTYILLVTLLIIAVRENMKDILYLIAGFMINAGLKDSSNYWFGSSPVSRDKDRAIATLTDTQRENTLNVAIKSTDTDTADAIIALQKDESTELAELSAIENRTETQETRLQELKTKLKNV